MKKAGFKEGDFVSFLNEKQEGVVREIRENGTIIIDIEDGFPIEVSPNEIVLVRSKIEATVDKDEAFTPSSSRQNTFLNDKFPELFAIKNELYLLIIPTANQVSSGPVKIYLINSTGFHFVFTIHTRKNGLSAGLEYGTIQPDQSIYLTELKREDLFELGEIVFDGLIYGIKPHNSPARVHKTLDLIFPDITQTFPKLTSPLCFAKHIQLYFESASDMLEKDGLLEKLKSEYAPHQKQKTVSRSDKSKSKISDVLSSYGLTSANHEVDLHIEELISDVEKLDTSSILQIQLTHFKKELDKALLHHARSIVFIHGIGNGKLKAEIRKELKSAGLSFTDGAFNKYGAGATEVFL